MFGNPMEIAILVGAAVLLFGADRVPKLARSLGQTKKEFMVGQAEADVEHERARAEARAAAEARTTGEAHAVDATRVTEPQTANGVIVGSPTVGPEPPAPRT